MRLAAFINFIFYLCVNNNHAQNLVLNSQFEQYLYCPIFPAQSASSWGSFNTPNYYHFCSISASPIINILGSQIPHSDSAFIGMYCFYFGVEEREFVNNTLTKPLESSKTYCGEFYISMADSVSRGIDSYGMLISDSLLTVYPLQVYTPQIANTPGNVILDKHNWTKISGTYTAHGGEQYIHLGNFNNDANTLVGINDTVSGSNTAYEWRNAYYYLDDVSLEELLPAQTIDDTTIYPGSEVIVGNNGSEVAVYTWTVNGDTVSTNANPAFYPLQTTTYTLTKKQCETVTTSELTVTVNPAYVNLYPNPNNGTFNLVYYTSEQANFTITNAIGQIVYNQSLAPTFFENTVINLPNLLSGVYHTKIIDIKQNLLFETKFVCVK